MLAERIEVNVLDDDHLPIVFLEHRSMDDLDRVLLHTRSEEAHGLGDPLWGLDKPLPLGIFA